MLVEVMLMPAVSIHSLLGLVAVFVARYVRSRRSIFFWCTVYSFSAFHSESSGSSGYSSSSCSGVECSLGGIIAGSVFGFLFAVAAVVLGIVYCYCRNKRKPWQSNQVFVQQASPNNLPPGEAQSNSGHWSKPPPVLAVPHFRRPQRGW